MERKDKFQRKIAFLGRSIFMSFFLLWMAGFTGCRAEQVTGEIVSEIEETKEQVTVQAFQTEPAEQAEVSDKEEKEEEIGMQKEEMNKSAVKKYSESGALHVEGTRLTDSMGQLIQLRGTSTHGLAWFPQYVNQEFFLELSREWNVNVVRLAMYTAENGGYCTDGNKEELKQLVKDGIDYATEADLYVIVDWHILSDGNPHTYKAEAKKFFEEISGEFADYENIIYEICNEPNGNVSWADVKAYAEEIIPIIRANDEDAVIIVGTPTWSQDVDKAAADPITGYDNIMYALHFYAATHTDWLRDRMVNALNAGLPVFVSEFGTCDASGSGGIDYEQSDAWIEKMDEYGVSYVTWNLSNKGETSAIFQPGCYKKSGFTEEDFSENGKWILGMLTGEHAGDCQETAPIDKAKTTVEDDGAVNNDAAVQEKKEDDRNQSENVQGYSGELQYTAVISNSWEAEGKTFYQYNVTLKNSSEKEIGQWEIKLSFSDTITLSDGWNGSYEEKGKVLEITSKDYNGQVAPGGEVSDVGFIISGSDELKILSE